MAAIFRATSFRPRRHRFVPRGSTGETTLTASLYENTTTFHVPRVDHQIFADLFTNTASFHAPNVGHSLLADLVTNSGQPGALVQPPAPIPIARGQELGAFNLGSTVVLLVADPLLRPAGISTGEFIAMGRPLWKRAPA